MKVAVCGLGRMGRAFAEALVADGHEVTGWNRTPRGVPGVPMAATAADAARGAEAVVVTVFDGPAAEAVLLGPGGVLDGVAAAPGTVVVNATTLGPDESGRSPRKRSAPGRGTSRHPSSARFRPSVPAPSTCCSAARQGTSTRPNRCSAPGRTPVRAAMSDPSAPRPP